MELLFLSFTTLSSTGLSDVVPVKDFARSVVMLEQLAGLAYVAIVVSCLAAWTRPGGGSLVGDRALAAGAVTTAPAAERLELARAASCCRSPG
jgi:hypothetical protein